jgi:hypothetical protein
MSLILQMLKRVLAHDLVCQTALFRHKKVTLSNKNRFILTTFPTIKRTYPGQTPIAIAQLQVSGSGVRPQ